MAEHRRQDALAHLHLAARGAAAADAGVHLTSPSVAAQLVVRGDVTDLAFRDACVSAFGFMLPGEPNTTAEGRGLTALWLGPDEWLVVSHGADAGLPARAAAAFAGRDHVPVDVGDARTVIRVAGRHAGAVLARTCPLDFAGSAMAPGRCARSVFARTAALIHVLPEAAGHGSRYDVYVHRSFADYAWRFLEDAGRDFGIAVA